MRLPRSLRALAWFGCIRRNDAIILPAMRQGPASGLNRGNPTIDSPQHAAGSFISVGGSRGPEERNAGPGGLLTLRRGRHDDVFPRQRLFQTASAAACGKVAECRGDRGEMTHPETGSEIFIDPDENIQLLRGRVGHDLEDTPVHKGAQAQQVRFQGRRQGVFLLPELGLQNAPHPLVELEGDVELRVPFGGIPSRPGTPSASMPPWSAP